MKTNKKIGLLFFNSLNDNFNQYELKRFKEEAKKINMT